MTRSARQEYTPQDPDADPRGFARIPVSALEIDERKQREVDPEKAAKIANEWDWARIEALTVVPAARSGIYRVVEGQHRSRGAQIRSAKLGHDFALPCMVLSGRTTETEQSQIALDIVQGRRTHSAYEQWQLRLSAEHPHEVYATKVMEIRKIRVGKAPSAMAIGAVATIRRIVHGGSHSPEYGAELLGNTLDLILAAYPTHDPESTTTRWDRWLLLAVSAAMHRFPDLDRDRFVAAMKVRPAIQWVNIGKGSEAQAPDVSILAGIVEGYNKGRRAGHRIVL